MAGAYTPMCRNEFPDRMPMILNSNEFPDRSTNDLKLFSLNTFLVWLKNKSPSKAFT